METTAATRGAVAVSPDELASRAGLEIMAAGGNAVDAAIAVNAVVGVVRPTDCGLGGDLFALIHRPGDTVPAVLNASGRAGSGASADVLRRSGHTTVPTKHAAAITVPGCVDGWMALLERLGTLDIGAVLAPAVRIARAGFPVSPEMAVNLAAVAELVADQDSAFELFPDGQAPLEGATLTRPAYGASLEAIGDRGRDAFYTGAVAAAIVAASAGSITELDLARNEPSWVEGAHIDVLGRTAWTVPPNSQGYITLATLAIFEQLGPPRSFEDPLYHHLLLEAYRAAAWDRNDHLADPDHMTLSLDELLHPLRIAERAAAVKGQAGTWPQPAPLPGGTAYMCTVDPTGMGVSLMQSNFGGIGSGISASATGIWLHNRGAGFSLTAGHPNELAPGRRPAHTLAPTLWTRDGDLAMLLGSRGADLQPQLVAQVAAGILHLGQTPGQAQAAPRWALESFGPGAASRPEIEEMMPAAVVDGLLERGHDVGVYPPQRRWGPVAVIVVDADGSRRGAADPRVSTAAVAT